MTGPTPPPPEVQRLLDERSVARERRDWPTADAIRERIRELGWDPVDGPAGSRARPWRPAPSADAQASLLDEPPSLALSVVAVVDEHLGDLARFVHALASQPAPAATELIVVANAPAGDLGAALRPWPAPVVLPVDHRLGWADAANLGLRRARGALIALIDTSLEPTGDWLTPLQAAFDDPTVGVAGGWGLTSADGRQFEDAAPGEVDAIEGYCLAVRREALQAVGGFDPRFRWYRHADLDLSFAIRAAGWRAIRTPPLPATLHEHRAWAALPPAERDRLSKRNFYRFRDHWGERPDLLLNPAASSAGTRRR